MKLSFKKCFTILPLAFIFLLAAGCNKEEDISEVEPSINLALDSIVTTRRTLAVWEEVFVTAYATGDSISYKWQTNHGSMMGVDSSTVKYWGCPSCVGFNTIECVISNSYGFVSDTIMVTVNP